MSQPEPASPSTNLANLILMLLAPMFLWSTNGDIRLAYTAAAQTLNEYRVTNRLSLFTVAKIIAFDIATLSSLSLSMYEETSALLALRLRGNANSLDRSAERNRRKLEQDSSTAAAGTPDLSVEAAVAEADRLVREAKARLHPVTAAPATPPSAEPAPATEPAAPSAPARSPRHQAAWAGAMTAVAEEFAAGLKDLPRDEQWKELARIKALTTAAADLAPAAPPPVPAMAAE
jgi:hypothetical protein